MEETDKVPNKVYDEVPGSLRPAQVQMHKLLACDRTVRSMRRLSLVLHAIDELEFCHLFFGRMMRIPVATEKLCYRRAEELEPLRVVVGHLSKELLPEMIRVHPPRKGRFLPIDRPALAQQIDF